MWKVEHLKRFQCWEIVNLHYLVHFSPCSTPNSHYFTSKNVQYQTRHTISLFCFIFQTVQFCIIPFFFRAIKVFMIKHCMKINVFLKQVYLSRHHFWSPLKRNSKTRKSRLIKFLCPLSCSKKEIFRSRLDSNHNTDANHVEETLMNKMKLNW